MTRRQLINTYLETATISGKSKREALKSILSTDSFFKTLFREDHPFLNYEIRDKNTCIEYRIHVKAPYLPHMPPFFGSIPIIDITVSPELSDKRFRDMFYKHVKNYIVDVLHFNTESERDALTLYHMGQVQYNHIIELFHLIVCNLDFIQAGSFDDAEEFGFSMESKNNNFQPIELIFNKLKIKEIVKQCLTNRMAPDDALKTYFYDVVTANIHRAKQC